MPFLSKFRISRHPGSVFIGLLLLCLAAVAIRYVAACAGGSDSSGYMNQARLLAQGQIHVPARSLPGLNSRDFSDFLYSPLGFRPDSGGIVPTYPIGLPLLILAAVPLAGWAQAANLVIVLHALAAIALLYALARELGLGWRGALVGAVSLAASPLFLSYSVQAMSDVPALTWVLAAAWTAWRARRAGVGDPGYNSWPVATGFCLAVAVLVRPTNLLLVPALAVGWWPLRDRRVPLAILGGMPGAIGFALYNKLAYGAPLATGYGAAGALFQGRFFGATLGFYAHWLPALFTPAVFLFLLLPLRPGRASLFLFAWGAAYLAFYAFYTYTHEVWWYLRFVLPAAPALILGWIWVLRPFLSRLRARALAAALAIIAIAGGEAAVVQLKHLAVLSVAQGEFTYPQAMAWLRQHAPADAVLVCMQTSGAAFYYTSNTILRWDEIERQHWGEVVRAAADANRPIYAPLFDFEARQVLHERLPGDWAPVAHVRAITIWKWMGPRPAAKS